MPHPLMPKATAVWLIDKTTLTFEQIAQFCGLHELEVQAIADGEVAPGMHGLNPVSRGELTQEELDRCQQDPSTQLVILQSDKPQPNSQNKGARYTPVSKRGDRPNAIAWLLKNYPELADTQISRLIGTTKPTINAIRSRTHWNTSNITPQNPVGLGLCGGEALEEAIAKARKRAGRLSASGAATAPDGIIDKHGLQQEHTTDKSKLKTPYPNLESNGSIQTDASVLDQVAQENTNKDELNTFVLNKNETPSD